MQAKSIWKDTELEVLLHSTGYIEFSGFFSAGALVKNGDALDLADTIIENVGDKNDGWLPYPENTPDMNDEFYIVTTNKGLVNPAFYSNNSFHYALQDSDHSINHDVIAFQPMPDPYQREV